jgi:hypothetical protein
MALMALALLAIALVLLHQAERLLGQRQQAWSANRSRGAARGCGLENKIVHSYKIILIVK